MSSNRLPGMRIAAKDLSFNHLRLSCAYNDGRTTIFARILAMKRDANNVTLYLEGMPSGIAVPLDAELVFPAL